MTDARVRQEPALKSGRIRVEGRDRLQPGQLQLVDPAERPRTAPNRPPGGCGGCGRGTALRPSLRVVGSRLCGLFRFLAATARPSSLPNSGSCIGTSSFVESTWLNQVDSTWRG
eukprot:361873-Chlamydomonas_euryale.AAC.2